MGGNEVNKPLLCLLVLRAEEDTSVLGLEGWGCAVARSAFDISPAMGLGVPVGPIGLLASFLEGGSKMSVPPVLP